ncbi:copper amine oxidase N-terminal domain-containing protein [Paenibacillus sp. PR3]|uniref:Copper amine oxidase N-terminal domain-containing protein n=1 Tax=Paenibacillus terricola TaxID=2763503 RepID=A0ABR8MP78_9BACL|nr:stalk domain-containing protein [Paenibacillus terricola]MBD3917748.1 copper amine oxidase N-terminal domain-containing protein [Paenibacillus terricola]
MKKSLSLFLLLSLVLMLVPAYASAATAPVTVAYDGKAVKFTQPPVRKSNLTFVEAKPLAAQLGATYAFDTKTKSATIKKGATSIKLSLDSKAAYVNGVKQQLAVAPYSVKGYVIVPAEFVVKSFGGSVAWDGKSKLSITSPSAVEALSKQKAVNVINGYFAALSKLDVKGVKSAWLPTSWNAEDEEDLLLADGEAVIFTVKSVKVTSFTGTKATIKAEVNINYPSPYQIDEIYSITYTMVKDSAGAWKIKQENLEDYNYDLPNKPVNTTQTFSTSVEDAVNQLIDNLNAEDLDAVQGMFAEDSMSAEMMLDFWADDFDGYDTRYELSDLMIIGADEAKGTATVYVALDAEDEESAYPYDVVLFLVRDEANNWKIQELTEL